MPGKPCPYLFTDNPDETPQCSGMQGTRVLSITAMMMSALVAGVCAYIVSMLPCTGPSFTPYICSLFHVMCAPCPCCSARWPAPCLRALPARFVCL